jgi:hypothetical protein
MSAAELADAARERLDAAIAAGRLAPRPSPETIRRIADVIGITTACAEDATKRSGEIE